MSVCDRIPIAVMAGRNPGGRVEGNPASHLRHGGGYGSFGRGHSALLAEKYYSGEFRVRIPPQVHRALAMQAAEQGVSLNRLASAELGAELLGDATLTRPLFRQNQSGLPSAQKLNGKTRYTPLAARNLPLIG